MPEERRRLAKRGRETASSRMDYRSWVPNSHCFSWSINASWGGKLLQLISSLKRRKGEQAWQTSFQKSINNHVPKVLVQGKAAQRKKPTTEVTRPNPRKVHKKEWFHRHSTSKSFDFYRAMHSRNLRREICQDSEQRCFFVSHNQHAGWNPDWSLSRSKGGWKIDRAQENRSCKNADEHG